MASPKCISTVLAVLHEAEPTRQLTKQTAEIWLAIFADVDDAKMLDTAKQLVVEPGRRFFPSPGEFRAKLQGQLPALDVAGITRRIEALGMYNPHVGWIWPRVDAVRDALGEGIARAYGVVGARLGADDETTRSIAQRDFHGELHAILEREGPTALEAPKRLALPSGDDAKQLGDA